MSTTDTTDRTTHDDGEGRRPRRRSIIIAVVAVAALLVAGGALFGVFSSAPAAVSLDATGATGATTGDGDAAIGDPSGTWSVLESDQPFDVGSPSGTFVGFRIDEELASIGATTAVGRTPVVRGQLVMDATTLVGATVEADLTAIRSDDARREGPIQRTLGTGTDPVARFELTEPVTLARTPDGDPQRVDAVGRLSVAGASTPVTVALDVVARGDRVTVAGTTDIALDALGIQAPSAPVVVSVADTATVELLLELAR